MKAAITPGKLYARIAAQFRARRGNACKSCAPGVPVLAAEGRANWSVSFNGRECEACAEAIADIVRGLQAQFELFDPTSPLHYGLPATARGLRPH